MGANELAGAPSRREPGQGPHRANAVNAFKPAQTARARHLAGDSAETTGPAHDEPQRNDASRGGSGQIPKLDRAGSRE